MKNKKLKATERGITLIALIITIIVLLILAGITLSALTGDSGILSNVEKAAEQTKMANLKEIAELVKQETILNQVSNFRNSEKIKKATLIANLNKEFKDSTVENGIITTSDGKYDIVVREDLEIIVVKHGDDFLRDGEIDIVYYYDEAEQEDEVIVSVYARIGGVAASYEEYAEKTLKGKSNNDKELMFVEADKFWNGVYPGTENITDFATYIAKVLEEMPEDEVAIPKTLTEFKNIFAPDFETVDEMLIAWEYVEPDGWYGKQYTQYAQEILNNITETGEEREKVLEQYYIETWNYWEFGEQIYTTWEDLMLYWQEQGWETYESLEDLAVNDYGYNNAEEFLLYDDWWIDPQGYEEYEDQFMEEFYQERIVGIACSNNESYSTVIGEIVEFHIKENGKYTFTATTYKGKTEKITIEINNIKILQKPEEAGKRFEKDEEIEIAGEKVSMPAGFTLSGAKGECELVENGIVIYLIPKGTTVDWDAPDEVLKAQKTYDQFVWVPVPKEDIIAVDMDGNGTIDTTDIDEMIADERFPMAIANGTNADGSTKYRAVLYDFELSSDGTKVEVTDKSYTAESGYWEPGYLTNSLYADKSTYNNVGIEEDTLQKAFDSMIAKVKSNGGFWVGRYETSNMVKGTSTNTASNDETNKVTVIKGTTTGIADTDGTLDGTGLNWYRMYAQQKNYATKALGESSTRTSSMIWGSQWDQIMIWMRKVENETKNSFFVVNSLSMGNYATSDDKDASTTAPVATGNSENYKVKNIYDLAGNVYEWTLEAYLTFYRAVRGGHCISNGKSPTRADCRYYSVPRTSFTSDGSRPTLY